MNQTKASNITWHEGHVERSMRQEILRQKGCTVWLTGLPSSGKSTTAFTLEHELIKQCRLAYVLDGDNIRYGLNKNLGFSAEDREENIRRIGEVAKLFADAGIITITSFISPYKRDRNHARAIHEAAGIKFIEILIDTPMDICEIRDPKGLYAKARAGEIKGFTGVDDPYEYPDVPEMILKTGELSPAQCALKIMELLTENGLL